MYTIVVTFWVILNGITGTAPTRVTIDFVGGADPVHNCQLYAEEGAQDWVDKRPGWLLLLDDNHPVKCVVTRGV